MEKTIVRKRKERTHTLEAEEENCMQKKKKTATELGRKRKQERTHTLEEEEHCRQTKKEKSKIDVSFSKRRRGLFGKAARLCSDFSDTRLAVLVVSKASRPYAFGHSSVNEVLNDLYHIHPTSTKSVEGLNLMKQLQEQKKVMGVKEEIENEMMACRTVEGLALLRDKYLKLGEHIKERLRYCSSASFEGGEIDQKYNINNIINNVGDEGRSLGSRQESSFHNLLNSGGLRLGGVTGGERCCFGLEHKDATTGISGNSLLASTEKSYGVHDGSLTTDGAVDGNGCSLGLWNVDGENSLRVSTTGIGDISWLASTNYSVNDGGLELDLGIGNEVSGYSLGLTNSTSGNSLCSTTNNYGVDGGLRLRGDNNGNGCSLGLWHEVSDHPLKDSTTEISGHVLLASAISNYGVDGNLRLNGDIDAEGCSLGLWYEGSDNPFKNSTVDDTVGNVASTTSNDGLDGDLRLNGDIITEGCTSRLWYEVSDNPLRDVSAVDSGTVLLATTTSNGGSGGELRSKGDIEALGCSSGLRVLEVDGNFSGDLTTGFNDLYSGDFDVSSPLAWDCSSTNGACLERVDPASTDLVQSNTNKGYYSYLMEADIDNDLYSFEDSCNFLL